MLVGLTGGIASGKSTVSSILEELGAVIIDADQIAREVVEPYTPAWKEIKEYFGEEIILPTAELNRKKLGSIIFNDAKARERLNQITHPQIIERIEEQIEKFRALGEEMIVAEVPLLIELEMMDLFTEIWVVYVQHELQLQRLQKRDGIDYQAALARIESQLPLDKKVEYADRVIVNEGNIEDLQQEILSIWREIN